MNIDLRFWEDNSQELLEIKPLIQEIQSLGMCGSPQPEFLFCLSYSLQNKGEIVEIGTCAGTSLIVLSYAQKLKKSGRIVNSIDLKKDNSLDSNLERAKILDCVNILIGDSSQISMKWNKPIELLWIDGDHSYKGVLSDIKNWARFLIKGGLIAFHDFRNGTGVAQAIQDTLLSKPHIWRVLSDRKYGSIFVMEKIADDEESPPQWIDHLTINSNKTETELTSSILSLIKRKLTRSNND